MCQITLANLHDEDLNKMFFLLSGTTGSLIHDDGWGFVQAGSPFFKCRLPMYLTSNSGSMLADSSLEKNNYPLLGHIRQASPKVPVTDENAHPFIIEDVLFVHNGKLVPVDEKKFVMEETFDDVDKTGKPIKVTVSRSDSLIFFEHFMTIFEANTDTNPEKKFVESLNEAMKDFCGKFAMVFLVGNTYYVVRGKTADLHIAYLMEGDEVKGWVINTDKKVLDFTTNLLSNVQQLVDRESGELVFTNGKLLDAESIYLVEDSGLKKIGEIPEKAVPVTTYKSWEGGASNFTAKGNGTSTTKPTLKTDVEKYAEKVYTFMMDWCLSLYDINNLFLICYDLSIKEADLRILKNFAEVVVPLLKNATTKKIRKQYRLKLVAGFPVYLYSKEIAYPWMLNDKSVQLNILEGSTKKK